MIFLRFHSLFQKFEVERDVGDGSVAVGSVRDSAGLLEKRSNDGKSVVICYDSRSERAVDVRPKRNNWLQDRSRHLVEDKQLGGRRCLGVSAQSRL